MDEINAFMSAIDSFLDIITPKFSYESFLEFLSEYFDKKIIVEVNNSDCNYIGGFCYIIPEGDDVLVKAEMYYQKNGIYDKHILNAQVSLKKFVSSSQDKLRRQGIVKFNIVSPI